MSTSAGKAVWQLAFQSSPIILTGGLAGITPLNMLPLVALTEAINFPAGLLSGGGEVGLDQFFANWEPVGGTIIRQEIGHYPFANQGVAANAVIQQPLDISMRMTAFAKGDLGYFLKLAIMEALQASLDAHNKRGGTYIVLTPSYIYTSCILKSVREASTGLTKQPQNAWLFDFEQPLITLNDIESAQSSLMSRITNALKIDGQNPAWSGISSAGATSLGQAGPALSPALGNAAASSAISVTTLAPPAGTVATPAGTIGLGGTAGGT